MIALGFAAALLVAIALGSVRVLIGPTLYDRALAAHAVIFLSALCGAAIAVAASQPAWIDAAIALILADVVLAIAILKYFGRRSMQPPLSRGEDAA